jgi:uroporphyrinogen-III decarboxylase
LGKPVDMSLHSYELPIPDVVEWNRRMGNDMAYFSHIWRLGRREMRDADGRRHYVDGTMKTPQSLADMWFPDLGPLRRRLEELLQRLDGTGLGVVVGITSVGFVVATAIGYQDFCLAVMENPGFVADFHARVYEYAMRELEVFLSYPVAGIRIGSGLITNNGPMLNPEMMERYEYGCMRRQAERVKATGKVLMFHIDGKVDPVLPVLLEMGADVLHPIDPCGGQQDIYDVKRRWGERIALHGNFDISGVLLKGTPEEVAADVRCHIERLCPGGGYIAASSHDLHQLLPVASIYAMRDAVHEWRGSRRQGVSR